jgi:5-formyltetrahydrofolate cyclo-ligase
MGRSDRASVVECARPLAPWGSLNTIQIKQAKNALRKEIRAKFAQLTSGERSAASARARELLCSRKVWIQARSVLFFAPTADEIDIWPLLTAALAQGKAVALPRYDPILDGYVPCEIRDCESDLCAGRFGIREPLAGCSLISGNRLDLMLVPGIAFDLHGRRLGRGKGYYDRWLAAMRGKTCGVAFDEQILDAIPFEPHDLVVNCILTPTRWIEP